MRSVALIIHRMNERDTGKQTGAEAPGGLSHLDEKGRARMVDVGSKPESPRRAVASGAVKMSDEALAAIREGRMPKGDVLAAARIAGIQAAKRTSELIPLCHPLRLTRVEVDLRVDEEEGCVRIAAVTEAVDRTGVEMEALTAVSAAALTVYDMAKALDRGMSIEAVRLEEKDGGRSGAWRRGTDLET